MPCNGSISSNLASDERVSDNLQIFDNDIIEKWKSECMAMKNVDVSEPMMEHLIAELQWKASKAPKSASIVVYNGDVVKSDKAVEPELMQSLCAGIKMFEEAHSTCKDYHPGSNEQVLDLVHPSLLAAHLRSKFNP